MTGTVWAAAAVLAAVAVLLRLPYRGIALENNGGYYLLACRDIARGRPSRAHPWAPLTMAILLPLFRLLGSRREYRWIRSVGVAANAATALAFVAGGAMAGSPAWGIAGGALYVCVSSVPHLIPWFTCPEWYGAPFATLGFFLLPGVLDGSSGLLTSVAAGLLFLAPGGFKLSGLTAWGAVAVALASTRAPGAGAFAAASGAGLLAGGAWILARHGISALRDLTRYKSGDVRVRGMDSATGQARGALSSAREIAPGLAPLVVALAAWAATASEHGGRQDLLAISWLAGGVAELAVQRVWYPGHWVPAVAPAACLGGLGLVRLWTVGGPVAVSGAAGAMALALAAAILSSRRHPWGPAGSRRTQEPFRALAHLVAERTPPDETAFFWGWHPQMTLLSDRESPAPDLTFCDAIYLDRYTPDWRARLVEGFAKHPPQHVAVLNRGFPLHGVEMALGLTYEPLNDTLLALRSRPHPATLEGVTFDRALTILRATLHAARLARNSAAVVRLEAALRELAPDDPLPPASSPPAAPRAAA